MKVNVKQFLEEAGITEAFYPGKRLVHACRQEGQFKSHSVVLDWRNPEKIRIELRAGLTGKELSIKELKSYPVSFQMPTFVDIEIINDNKDDDKEGKSSGSGGGGGKSPKKSLESMRSLASEAFGSVREGKIPEMGKIVEMVIMGTKVAAEAYGKVMGVLAKQLQHAKIQATDLLAQAGDFVTKYTPPAFMAPTGDEQKVYKYDREKNADIGFRPGPG
ncbi:MAG: hypothetical protein KA155_01395 [Alphaproteobacteria bacterium]|jgi:hypothetical protein|nr:hypothetical protein [Alphaproteobacteria bacterium]